MGDHSDDEDSDQKETTREQHIQRIEVVKAVFAAIVLGLGAIVAGKTARWGLGRIVAIVCIVIPVISLIIGLVSYAHWGERTKSGRWARGASTACWVGVSGLMFSIAISGGGIGGRKRSVSFGGWQEESSNLVGRANWSSGRFDLIKGGLETASGLPTLAWAIGILALLNLCVCIVQWCVDFSKPEAPEYKTVEDPDRFSFSGYYSQVQVSEVRRAQVA